MTENKPQRLGFTEPNYEAVLARLKSQTRRAMRETHLTRWLAGEPEHHFSPYHVGERVALTLPWYRCAAHGVTPVTVWDAVSRCVRYADGGGPIPDVSGVECPPWRRQASYVMPVWAALHTAMVTGVRAERLGEITNDGCEREGIYFRDGEGWAYPGQQEPYCDSAQQAYRAEWEMLHGTDNWSPNLPVWVIDFGDVQPYRP